MRLMIFSVVVPALVLISTHLAHAAGGANAGNGGDGVLISGTPYLLDLVEHGIETHPFFDSSISPKPDVVSRIAAALRSVPDAPTALIAQKILEIDALDRTLAMSLMRSMEMYSWIVLERALVDLPKHTTIHVPHGDWVQLAIRKNQVIRISSTYWKKLNSANQAALILHEAAYGMLMPSRSADETFSQESSHARDFIGFVFSQEMKTRGYNGLVRVASGWLPMGFSYVRENGDGNIEFDPTFYGLNFSNDSWKGLDFTRFDMVSTAETLNRIANSYICGAGRLYPGAFGVVFPNLIRFVFAPLSSSQTDQEYLSTETVWTRGRIIKDLPVYSFPLQAIRSTPIEDCTEDLLKALDAAKAPFQRGAQSL